MGKLSVVGWGFCFVAWLAMAPTDARSAGPAQAAEPGESAPTSINPKKPKKKRVTIAPDKGAPGAAPVVKPPSGSRRALPGGGKSVGQITDTSAGGGGGGGAGGSGRSGGVGAGSRGGVGARGGPVMGARGGRGKSSGGGPTGTGTQRSAPDAQPSDAGNAESQAAAAAEAAAGLGQNEIVGGAGDGAGQQTPPSDNPGQTPPVAQPPGTQGETPPDEMND